MSAFSLPHNMFFKKNSYMTDVFFSHFSQRGQTPVHQGKDMMSAPMSGAQGLHWYVGKVQGFACCCRQVPKAAYELVLGLAACKGQSGSTLMGTYTQREVAAQPT